MSKLKTYHIPVIWKNIYTFPVEAYNLQQAVELALKEFLSIPSDLYLEDSVEIDDDIKAETGELFDLNKALNNITT